MALTPLERRQALDLLILELVVMEDTLGQLQGVATKTGFTAINGSLKALQRQAETVKTKISGRKARMENSSDHHG